MTLINDFLTRVEAFAATSGQSLSTISRKLLNDGKGIARLQEGGQCTLKTLEEALVKLDALEMEHSGADKLRMTHLDRLEAESIHIMREVAAQCENHQDLNGQSAPSQPLWRGGREIRSFP